MCGSRAIRSTTGLDAVEHLVVARCAEDGEPPSCARCASIGAVSGRRNPHAARRTHRRRSSCTAGHGGRHRSDHCRSSKSLRPARCRCSIRPSRRRRYARNAAGIPIDAPSRSFETGSTSPNSSVRRRTSCTLRVPDLVATLDVLATIDTAALDPIRDRPGALGCRWSRPFSNTSSPCRLPMRRPWSPSLSLHAGSGPDRHADVRAMAAALGERYPGDAGVVTALLLNLVHLKLGEALFLGAGNLTYLGGTGVEIMANSTMCSWRADDEAHRHLDISRSSTPDRSNRSCSAPLVQGIASATPRFPSSCSTARSRRFGDRLARRVRAPAVRSMPVACSSAQRPGSPLVTDYWNSVEDAEPSIEPG